MHFISLYYTYCQKKSISNCVIMQNYLLQYNIRKLVCALHKIKNQKHFSEGKNNQF